MSVRLGIGGMTLQDRAPMRSRPRGCALLFQCKRRLALTVRSRCSLAALFTDPIAIAAARKIPRCESRFKSISMVIVACREGGSKPPAAHNAKKEGATAVNPLLRPRKVTHQKMILPPSSIVRVRSHW